MSHPRLIKDESKIEQLRRSIPAWIKHLERPKTPCIAPAFGPLQGIRAVGTGQLIAQPYIGTKLAEFGAEVVQKPGGDVFRFTAPQLLRGPRPHGGDEAEVTKNKLSMGLDFKKARGIELLMALWKISDVWMESSAPGTSLWARRLAVAISPAYLVT
jgi:crotonobetainyl-CoA:carnitine CoA-transferase CaiB-like acyl-CoA transferase